MTARPSGDECQNLIPETAHTLRADGFDASEDGTGRGVPIIPVAFARQAGGTQTTLGYDPESGTAPCLSVGQVPAIAFTCKDHGADAGEVAPTLRAMGHAGSHANAGGQVAVAVDIRNGTIGGPAHTVQAAGLGSDRGGNPNAIPHVQTGMHVRRLTPRECERLQGAPDDWSLVPNAKGKPMADGPRYKMIGNSFAAPVVEWIGRRIESAHRAPAA